MDLLNRSPSYEPVSQQSHPWFPLVSRQSTEESRNCIHPTKPGYRYCILLTLAFICFGSYYAYDEIEPIEKEIRQSLEIDYVQFGLLYSIYSLPNVLLPFFGGTAADKLGLRMMSLAFSFLVSIGAALCLLATYVPASFAFGIMMAGRGIFGMGAESLNVLQTTMAGIWFRGGPTLSFAIGLCVSSGRLADFIALSAGARLMQVFGDYRATMWVGLLLCVLSYIALVFYVVLDKSGELYYNHQRSDVGKLNFKAIKSFDVRYWLLCVLCITHYCSIFPLIAVLSDFLQTTFAFDQDDAGVTAGSIILFAMVFSPIFGKILDTIGKRPLAALISSAVMIIGHVLFSTVTQSEAVVPALFFIGLPFSVVPSTIWPSVVLLTDSEELGTANGLMVSLQNAGLVLMNFLVGYFIQHFGYRTAMILFVVLDVLSVMTAGLLYWLDLRRDRCLMNVHLSETKPIERPYIVWFF